MFKENGRTSKVNNESAAVAAKPFKCDKCGAVVAIKNVEFGEIYECPSCKGALRDLSV